ncbi:hypothetical protein RRG08_038669 [Elysia crispata]|uniref:Uncharacterized protein n=1 Tax=Elysia crispata TaxID=231223 RepID=A0AAE0ZJZ9_9GAST|nr:hypothetical protein RRG08_038669 [Elysia crispata]
MNLTIAVWTRLTILLVRYDEISGLLNTPLKRLEFKQTINTTPCEETVSGLHFSISSCHNRIVSLCPRYFKMPTQKQVQFIFKEKFSRLNRGLSDVVLAWFCRPEVLASSLTACSSATSYPPGSDVINRTALLSCRGDSSTLLPWGQLYLLSEISRAMMIAHIWTRWSAELSMVTI